MKPIQTRHNDTVSKNRNAVSLFLLLSACVIFSFGLFLGPSDAFSKKGIESGTVQETLGYWIGVLGRFDQEREARLQQQWNGTVQQYSAFVNDRERRLQEILGLSIAHTTRMILMEQERLRTAVMDARTELERFNREKPARWQEKLGGAVLTAYRRAPEGGVAFQLAFEHATNRLRVVEARTARRLESNLKTLTAREADFPKTIPLIYQEAIQSAHRSARMLEESRAVWVSRILGELKADLSWQRRPEDYVQLVGVIRDVLTGNWGIGGFVEYGLAALVGLLVAMAWVGLTVPKDPLGGVADVLWKPVADLSRRKAA